MQHPKVSVVIPNYNHCRYLPDRIASILGQTFGDFELIILDDASTDESHSVLARYYSTPRVRIVVNTRNGGSAFPQWNRGIGMAKGEYVWIAESDDFADPRFLETLLPVLEDNPSVGLAYCKSRMINRDGAFVGTDSGWTMDLHPTRWEADFVNAGIEELRDYLIVKNTIPNASAVLTRRAVLLQAGAVDTSFKLCGDWLHWGKLLLQSDIAHVALPLNNWRVESSNSRTHLPGVIEWQEGKRVVGYFTQALGCSASESSELLLRYADQCFEWANAASKTLPQCGR